MFGPRLSTVFASRWKALWWSACVLLTAYCSVPSPDKGSDANPAALVGKHKPKHHESHVNPWAATPGKHTSG
jgi:hypothetical protein